MKIKRHASLLSLLLVLGLTAFGPSGHAESAATLDPRLGDFLEFVIKDPAVLEREKKDYASRGVTFEPFIYAVYTGAVKIDNAPDNDEARGSVPMQEPWLSSGNTSRSSAPNCPRSCWTRWPSSTP